MLIRALSKEDIPLWFLLSRKPDFEMEKNSLDISVGTHIFNEYMTAKIEAKETFMAIDKKLNEYIGMITLSRQYNKITFLAISFKYNIEEVGDRLFTVALRELDPKKPIIAHVLKSNSHISIQEQKLYEKHGFRISNENIIEEGVPAFEMQKPESISH